MDKPTLAILLAVFVHGAGIALLLWLALNADSEGGWRDWWPRDDDGGDEPPAPEPPAPLGGLPLPDAEPALARLRDEHDAVPRRDRRRRPVHAPERAPDRERV